MLRLLASDIMTGGWKWADDFTILNLIAAGTNPLVVRRSLRGDEDRGAEMPRSAGRRHRATIRRQARMCTGFRSWWRPPDLEDLRVRAPRRDHAVGARPG